MAADSLQSPIAAQPAVAAQAPGCLDLMGAAVNYTRVTFQIYLEKQPLLLVILAVACVVFGLSPFLPTAVNLVIFTVPLLVFTYFVVETIIQHPHEILLAIVRDLNKSAIEDAQRQTSFRETAQGELQTLKRIATGTQRSAPQPDRQGLGGGYVADTDTNPEGFEDAIAKAIARSLQER